MPNLHGYQRADGAIMAGRRGTLLAYETGGGKTAAMIEAGRRAAPGGPWWITTRRDAVGQFDQEIKSWAPGFSNYILCSHEDAHKYIRAGMNAPFVAVDESDEARNVETQLFKTLYPVCTSRSAYGPKRVILATATPVHNGPADLIAPLILAGVYSWDQYQQLVLYYTDPTLDGFAGMDTRGSSNLAELAGVLSAVMIRRTYSDFGFRMPTPIFYNQDASAAAGAQGDAYRLAAGDFSKWYRHSYGRTAPPLARFVTLRRLLELAKIPATVAAIAEDVAAGAKSLTFCEFRETAQALHKEFKGSGLIMGGDTIADRAEIVESLAAGGTAPTIATTGALKSALNMQTIDRSNYVSMGWDPSAFTQTAGRAWRQGRKTPVLFRRFFFPDDDLEKYLLTVLERKEDVLKTLGLLPTLNVSALVGI